MPLLVEERQKRQAEAERRSTRSASALAACPPGRNSIDLIVKLEQGLDSAARSAKAAARSSDSLDREHKSDARPNLAALKDPGRLSPGDRLRFGQGNAAVAGQRRQNPEFGAPDGLGGTEKGLSIATRAGAQVTAPCDGWVVYAGPFRNYGQLLILNAGGGYHVLLAGMERISVDLGQFVLTGEPVAVMGAGPVAAAIAAGASQPVLYVEFRKDGTPVDPGPWWAQSEGEKVRG